jgi:hypothetical protein
VWIGFIAVAVPSVFVFDRAIRNEWRHLDGGLFAEYPLMAIGVSAFLIRWNPAGVHYGPRAPLRMEETSRDHDLFRTVGDGCYRIDEDTRAFR